MAAAQRRAARAATLVGAADRQFERFGLRDRLNLGVRDDAAYERDVAVIRGQLGEPAFSAAWARGRAMSAQQAVAFALADDEPEPRGPAVVGRALEWEY